MSCSEPDVYCDHSYIKVDLCSSVSTPSNSRLVISYSSRYKSVTLLSVLRIIVSNISVQHLSYPTILSNMDIDRMGPLLLLLGEMILENAATVDDYSFNNRSIFCFRSIEIKSTSIPIDLKAVGVQASLWVAQTATRVNPTSIPAHRHQCSSCIYMNDAADFIPFVKQVGDYQLFMVLDNLLPALLFMQTNATCFSPPSTTFGMEPERTSIDSWEVKVAVRFVHCIILSS